MTPRQFAQGHCANYQSDGSCLGARIDDDGAIRSCAAKPKCVLPGRCRYFEECVAPNALRLPPAQARAAQQAYRQYRLCQNEPVEPLPITKDRHCECGAALEPRQRLCAPCKKNHRRVTWRLQKRSESGSYN